jgi:hypothetical protein
MTRQATVDAVAAVFAASAAGDACHFPVVRAALGHRTRFTGSTAASTGAVRRL